MNARKLDTGGETMDSYNPGGDQIEQLYNMMYERMLSYAKCVLLDHNLAEEAVQNTFCIACMKTEEMLSNDNPNGWLMLTLQNVMRNMKRQRASMSRLIMDSLRVEDIKEAQIQDEENIDILYGDVSARSDFKLLKRIVLDGYSMMEVADEFGITVAACKKRVQRSKSALRKKLSKFQK